MVRLWAAKLQPSIVETPTVRIKYDEKHEPMWSYYPSVSTAPLYSVASSESTYTNLLMISH